MWVQKISITPPTEGLLLQPPPHHLWILHYFKIHASLLNKINHRINMSSFQYVCKACQSATHTRLKFIGIWNVGIMRSELNCRTCQKNLGARNKLHPHIASTLGFEPRSGWWEVSILTTTLSHAPLSVKAHLNGFDFCPTFYSTNLLKKCWVHLNRSVTLSKALN